MLYLVSTPIGNLKDITLRALDVLKTCDLIACEDTRVSSILLKKYNIKKPLMSLHKFSEAKREGEILTLLKQGKSVALISDAGTPTISDPGERIVKKCLDQSLPVSAIPGPASLITALICSGLSTKQFQFLGFLPKKTTELRDRLLDMMYYEGTSICFESPKRVEKIVQILADSTPQRKVVIAREMTKKFEEFIRGDAKSVFEELLKRQLKGEIVLLIEGSNKDFWKTISLEKHIQWLQDSFQISQKEAIKLAAKLRHFPKKEIYTRMHKLS